MSKALKIFLSLTLAFISAAAQQREIKGTVKSTDNNPIPGVTVSVAGTAVGKSIVATTQADGQYTIKVPAGTKTLIFSHVAYTTKVEVLGASSVLNVSLVPKATDLKEVVVTTALGIEKSKRALGYSTQTVKAEDLEDRGDGSILNLLQGKVAGAEITGAGGSAGASTNIILRGIGSMTGENQPLFVIDGVPVSNDIDQIASNASGGAGTLNTNQPPNRMMDLDPSNIESIDILQGPAGAALYGSRASAGAIIITTKKGPSQKGRLDINFNSSYTVQNVYGFPKLQTQYAGGTGGVFNGTAASAWGPSFSSAPSVANGRIYNPNATAPTTLDGVTYNPGDILPMNLNPNYITDFFEQGRIWNNNLSIYGGKDKSTYGFSLSQSSQSGILPESDFDRLNIKLNFQSELSDKLTLSGSITYLNTYQNGAVTQGYGAGSAYARVLQVTPSTNIAYYKENYKNADGSINWFESGSDNPYFDAKENLISTRLDRFLGNANISYKINKWLNISYRLGINQGINRLDRRIAPGSTQEISGTGGVTQTNFYSREINGDLILTAKKTDMFTKGLNFSGLLGQNIMNSDNERLMAKAVGMVIDNWYDLTNGQSYAGTDETKTKKRLLGYYAQMSWDWKRYLFLELTGRVDQSSTLPKDNNTYFYPSVSSSFIFTDAFKIKSKILTYGKLRASYARVGKDANPYKLDSRTYVTSSVGNNVAQFRFPYGSILGFTTDGLIGNPSLQPEFTYAYELGLNLGFFKDRLTFEGTVYNQGSNNQILDAGIAQSTGYGSMVQNLGKIQNKGLELMLTAVPVKNRNFNWNISGNFSLNRNKVIYIAPDVTYITIAGGNYAALIPTVYVGQPYGVIVGNQRMRSPEGKLLINPATGLYVADVVSNQILADPNKDWTAGLTNSMRYKNFTLSALVDLKWGGDVSSWTVATLRYQGKLAETGVNREMPRILDGVIDMGNGQYIPNNIQITSQQFWQALGDAGGNDFNIFDATTFRVREVTLGYGLTSKAILKVFKTKAIKNIRLSVYGRNLFYYAPNSMIDPEMSTQGAGNIRAIELKSAPNTRNFGASLRVGF